MALVSGKNYAYPFLDAQFDAVVTQPDGNQLRVPGLWLEPKTIHKKFGYRAFR